MKYENKKEKRTIKAEDGKKIEIEYEHFPNVGDRSEFSGLAIWLGKTVAKANGEKAIGHCWINEPFTYSQGRVVSTGRLLKKLGLPTGLAEQVKGEE